MLTAKQIEARRGWIGASDVAAILGVNPWQNPHDVWLAKTGRFTTPPNAAMDAGNRFEKPIMDWAEEQLGPMRRDVLLDAPEYLPMKARLDGLLEARPRPIEGKATGLFGPIPKGAWGDEGSDIVPPWHIVQVQSQMLCSNGDKAHIAAFLGGRGFQMFNIPRDDEVIDKIITAVGAFWRDNVQADTPPDIAPHLDVIKHVTRRAGVETEIDPFLVRAWQEAKELARAAKDAADVDQARMLAALGDGDIGLAGDVGRVTYFEQTRKAHEVAESTFRVLRFKKAK